MDEELTVLPALIALSLGIALWMAHYRMNAVKKPQLDYQPSAFNRRMVQRLEQLRQPYRPTPWLYNTHLQLLWLVLKDALAPRLRYDCNERLTMPDGGTVSLDWLGSDCASQTPTLVVLHTISGDAHSMRAFVSELRRLSGWCIVICTRRGHGSLPLTAPAINTMGCTNDLRAQLRRIHERFPESPLYAVGVSAGSGLLVRYLGEEGPRSLIRSGVAYCPGYDISVAFQRSHPFYSRKVAQTLKRKFLEPHAAHFAHLPSYETCLAARELAEFQDHIFEMAGCSSRDEYLARSNPMQVSEHIAVPVLVLNADDDPLCVLQNTLEHVDSVKQIKDALLVRTTRGSHCAYFEGWLARSWANRLVVNYFLAVHHELSGAS